jgi:two-component system sensor histidine kinase YesM
MNYLYKHPVRLRKWYTANSTVFIVITFIMDVIVSYYAGSAILQNSFATLYEGTQMSSSLLTDRMQRTESYLSGFAYDNSSIRGLDENGWQSVVWNQKAIQLRNKLTTAMNNQFADNFFFYSPDSELYIEGPKNSIPALVTFLKNPSSINTFFSKENSGHWVLVCVNGVNYFVRMLRVVSGYIGAWISVDNALTPFLYNGSEVYVDFSTQDGSLLRSSPITEKIKNFDSIPNRRYSVVQINNIPYVCVPVKTTDIAGVYLIAVVPDRSIRTSLRMFIVIAAVIFILGFMMLLCSSLFTRSLIIRPIHVISGTMEEIQAGHTDARIHTSFRTIEFNDMSNTFNEMMDQIANLQKKVYIETLRHEWEEKEYYKLQMTPHFLVNCLNIVYQLIESDHPDLALNIIKDLTKHLRYLLECPAVVSLRSEMEIVANYIDLSSIRYPGSIDMKEYISPEAQNRQVVPLLVVSFVENTVKHEVELGTITHIEVDADIDNLGNLRIIIMDDGDGFDPEVLTQLQDLSSYNKNEKKRIGIANVYSRAMLNLSPHCTFTFRNRDSGGAMTEIMIPKDAGKGQTYESPDCR